MSRWDDPSTVWDQFFWDAPDPPPTEPKPKRKPNRRTMASNPTPENPDVLRALADLMADGCHNHETAIGILHNKETVLRAALSALGLAETDLGLKKAALAAAHEAQDTADKAGVVTLTNCKLRLGKVLGQRWSAAWEPTGFPGQSTAVPNTEPLRFTLLGALKNYFTAVPASESADMEATAALCEAAWTALSDARQSVADAGTALTTSLNTRDAAVAVLRKRVRGLIGELENLISDDDPRWESFGLNIPAHPSAPGGIASLTAEAAGNGKIHLEWVYATRMTGTRLLTKRTTGATIDPDFISAGTADGLEKTLPGFVAGVTVELMAIPFNDGGDGPASPVVVVVVS